MWGFKRETAGLAVPLAPRCWTTHWSGQSSERSGLWGAGDATAAALWWLVAGARSSHQQQSGARGSVDVYGLNGRSAARKRLKTISTSALDWRRGKHRVKVQ